MPKKAGHFNTSLYLTSSFSYFVLFWRGMEGKYGSFQKSLTTSSQPPPPLFVLTGRGMIMGFFLMGEQDEAYAQKGWTF